jgi:beta-galactosidase
MDPLSFDRTSYKIGDTPIYLLSGEFHYFRVPKTDWRTRMKLFKEAGGNCLATYIPWLLHEPEEGVFQFSGRDYLDLESFLQSAQDEGLYVIARPGPYQYSELVNAGLPTWLLKNYPDILARDIHGKPFREFSISYLHPVFVKKVRTWFDAVCPILARYTVDQGGPIAFVQLDNELIGIHEWSGTWDYNPETMGFGQPDGRYPRFLQKRYASLSALNQSYSSDYAQFEDVHPIDSSTQPDAAFRRRKDYYEFYLGTIAEYSVFLADLIRAHGITVPLVHNSANPGMNAHFLETIQQVGPNYQLGSDHYYNLDQTWAQNNPTPQYAVRIFLSLEMLRLMGYPPTVFELPGGSLANWPPITPVDALACYFSNLAYGMKGSNYYIFTGGPNPPGAGTTTDLYDYGAGIGPFGDVRPLYHVQKTFGQFISQNPWLVTSERPADLRFALDFDQPRSTYYWTQPVDDCYSSSDAWNFLRHGPLTTALCAGMSPAFVNLAATDWISDSSTPLLVTTSSSMSAVKQQRLVDFIQAGGKLLITPVLPSTDENLNPCAILADFLGSTQDATKSIEQARTGFADVVNVIGSVFFTHPPLDANVIGKDEWTGKPVAWMKTFQKGGEVICLGMTWTHAMHEHTRMLTALLKLLGLSQILSVSNPNIWVTLWASQDSTASNAVLFLLNLFTSETSVEVIFHLNGKKHQVTTPLLPPMSVTPVIIQI